MPDTWRNALSRYWYPVNLRTYHRAREFPGFFEHVIQGDRESTISFEDHFRERAPVSIAAYLEVAYWKLYSQPPRRQKGTDRIADAMSQRSIQPQRIWQEIGSFVANPSMTGLEDIRRLIGITSPVLALALTFPALAAPQELPMVDRQVAEWVTNNHVAHNKGRQYSLLPFNMRGTSLQDNDFRSYLHWVLWCRETAQVLSGLTGVGWRPRDVEMAVFTAQRSGMPLDVLP